MKQQHIITHKNTNSQEYYGESAPTLSHPTTPRRQPNYDAADHTRIREPAPTHRPARTPPKAQGTDVHAQPHASLIA